MRLPHPTSAPLLLKKIITRATHYERAALPLPPKLVYLFLECDVTYVPCTSLSIQGSDFFSCFCILFVYKLRADMLRVAPICAVSAVHAVHRPPHSCRSAFHSLAQNGLPALLVVKVAVVVVSVAVLVAEYVTALALVGQLHGTRDLYFAVKAPVLLLLHFPRWLCVFYYFYCCCCCCCCCCSCPCCCACP